MCQRKLSHIPSLHETSLDHSFIEHFTLHCRPIQTPSDWTVRLTATLSEAVGIACGGKSPTSGYSSSSARVKCGWRLED